MITIEMLSPYDFDGSVTDTINMLQSLVEEYGEDVKIDVVTQQIHPSYNSGDETVFKVQIEGA